MDWLNLMGHHSVRLWIAQVIVILFLLGGITLLALGASLVLNSTAALRFIGGMNRWVSMRRATRPLEVPRDTRHVVMKYRYWFAAAFVAGGAVATYGLLTQFSGRAIYTMLGLGVLNRDIALWLIDSLRWMLVLGNIVAIMAGIMLAFFPDRVVALEAQGGRWYSARQMTRGASEMKPRLDMLVAGHPRAAGGLILLCGLAMIGTFGMMVPRVW